MKQHFSLILGILLSVCIAAAQPPRGKFNPEEFRDKLEKFITEKADLTDSEAKVFFPIYHEMKEKQRRLQHDIFKLKHNAPSAEAPEKEYTAAILQIKEKGAEMAALEVGYYKRMCKAVSPVKVFQAMLAEDRFHKKMLEEFRPGGHHPKGRGKRRGGH